jgi:hypothetical protein
VEQQGKLFTVTASKATIQNHLLVVTATKATIQNPLLVQHLRHEYENTDLNKILHKQHEHNFKELPSPALPNTGSIKHCRLNH